MEKKKIVVLTGAGMSAESGLSTFRDADGLWENYPVMQVASHEGWLADPELINTFYNGLRQQLVHAKPNEGHRLVAKLEEKYNVTVVTQNVDNLHERAGSTHVIHLHGELMKACSGDDAYNPEYIEEIPEDNPVIVPGSKTKDGALKRPFIVFFGEAVPMIETAVFEVETADMMIIIGTSLNVYPAAGLVRYLRKGAPVYVIDPKPVSSSSISTATMIRKGASEGMREHSAQLMK